LNNLAAMKRADLYSLNGYWRARRPPRVSRASVRCLTRTAYIKREVLGGRGGRSVTFGEILNQTP